MAEIFAYIGGGLGSIASIITIIQFFKPLQIKQKIVLFVVVLMCTTVSLYSWYYIGKRNEKNNIEKVKSEFLKNDAEITSSAINITGWENSGDYLGYLTQIVGFYGRHKEIYFVEYETNNKQLEHFTSFFNNKRDRNQSISFLEWEDLKGLVTSGRDNIVKISNSIK